MECLYNTFPISRWSSEARSAISQWLHLYTEYLQRSTHCHLISSSRVPVNNCQVLHHHESWHTEINKKWQDGVIVNFISLNENLILLAVIVAFSLNLNYFHRYRYLYFSLIFFCTQKKHLVPLVCSFWHCIGGKFLWVSYRSQLNPWLQYCYLFVFF